jgi:cell division protein ZapA
MDKNTLKADKASKIAIKLYGREYHVACAPQDQERLQYLASYVDEKMKKAAQGAGPSVTETRLFMLTCLTLVDELMEAKQKASQLRDDEESLYVAAVNHLAERITHIADQVGRA